MAHIFLSYSRKDGTKLAQTLAENLRKAGYSVYDNTQTFHGDVDWREEIFFQIKSSDLIVLLITSEYSRSDSQYEILREAQRLLKVILPFRINDAPLPPALGNMRAIRIQDIERELEYLQTEISRTVQQIANREPGLLNQLSGSLQQIKDDVKKRWSGETSIISEGEEPRPQPPPAPNEN